ncbi:hypothetical protein [Streptomyces sp. NPDC004050]
MKSSSTARDRDDHYASGRDVRPLSLHPADAPDDRLPAGHVVDRPRCRIVCRWLPARGGRGEGGT